MAGHTLTITYDPDVGTIGACECRQLSAVAPPELIVAYWQAHLTHLSTRIIDDLGDDQ